MIDKLAQQFVQRLFAAQAELAMVERDIALFTARRDALVDYIAANERIAEQLASPSSDFSDVAVRIGESFRQANAAILECALSPIEHDTQGGEARLPIDDIAVSPRTEAARPRKSGSPRAGSARRSASNNAVGFGQGIRKSSKALLSPVEKTVIDVLRDQSKPLAISDIAEEAGTLLGLAKLKPPLREVLQALQRRELVERVGHKWRITLKDEILAALFSR